MKTIDIAGAKVPALGFGTWPLTGDACVTAVKNALELGYRHIDTAQMYNNEADVGRAIRESGVNRADIFVTTKLGNGNLAAANVTLSAEDSLRKLGTGHIDLLLIHWPSKIVPMGETLDAMKRLQEAGTTRFIGVSNFTVKLLDEAIIKHGADLLCNQVEYHPFLSQRAVLAATRKHGLMLGAYSPVARGKVDRDPLLQRLAKKYGKTPAQISLRWLIDQDGVAPLPKAGHRDHAAANIDIFDFEIEAEDRTAIDRLGGNERITDIAGWAPEWDRA